jgi:hypothetical protein
LVGVSNAPLAYSKLNEARGNFEFRKDSAGLGVPRGSLGGLGHISNGVEQHGLVTRPVYVDRSQTVSGAEGGAGQIVRGGPATIRPGSPPVRDGGMADRGGYVPRGGADSSGNNRGVGNSGGGYHPSGGGGGGNAGGGYHPSGGGGGGGMPSSPAPVSAAPAGGGAQGRSGK